MISKKNEESPESIIRKDMLLLENPENAKAHRIRNIMSPSNKDVDFELKAQKLLIKDEINASLIEKYKDTALFTREVISKECIKFNLAFARSRDFKGQLSLDLIKKVNSFLNANNLIVSEDQFRTNIYLLGKAKLRSKLEGKQNVRDSEKDPLIFFKITEQDEEFFILIDGSKNYKTLRNLLSGFIHYNRFNFAVIIGILGFFLLNTLIIYCGGLSGFDFSIFKFFLLIPCYLIGRVVQAFYFDDPNGIYNSGDRNNQLNENFYSKFIKKTNYLKTLTIIGSFLFVTFMLNFLFLNLKLKSEGYYSKTNESTTRLTPKKSKELHFINVLDKDIYEVKNSTTTYTPGFFFYNKEEKLNNLKYIQK